MKEKLNFQIQKPDLNEMKENWVQIRKPFVCLLVIYLLGISAILRANYNYRDDFGRVFEGYHGWSNFSRYLTVILSNFIHADTYLTDISPFPQILAACIMALCGVLVICILTGKKKISLWSVIAVIPMGLSPYFLECFSYKYDAPYMALAVAAGILPLLFWEKGVIPYVIATLIGMLAMCTTYQAAAGIYPMLVILVAFRSWNSGKKIKEVLRFAVISAVSYVVGIMVFRLFIMTPFENRNAVSSSMVTSVGQIVKNYKEYISYITSDLKSWWLLLAALIVAAFLFKAVVDSEQNKVLSLLLALASVLLCALVEFGVYPLLTAPSYHPRSLLGFGMFLAFFGVSAISEQKTYLAKAMCLCLSYCFFAFSFTYGNALAEQLRYTNFRIETVIDGMNGLEVFQNDEMKVVQLEGNIGQSPVIDNMPQNYDILNRLVPDTFGGGWKWREYYFYQYFDFKNVTEDSSIDLKDYDLPVLKDTMYYTIKGENNYVLIELK